MIAELVEHTEAAAYIDLVRAAPPSFGLEVLETDGVTRPNYMPPATRA